MADLESLLRQAEQELSLDSGASARYLPSTVLRRIDHTLQAYASGISSLPFETLIKDLRERVKDRIRFEIQWISIPTIATTPIKRPLLVTGLFRSGTTLLYNLINADPASCYHATWQVFTIPVPPSKPNDDDPRKLAFEEDIVKSYNMHHIHQVSTDAPEEAYILFGQFDFFEFSWRMLNISGWDSPNMLGDGTTVDMREMFQFYRRYLQTLGSVSPPASHWIMKDPCNLWYLREFLDVFPDANVVILKRPLKETTPSSLSMFWNLAVGWKQWKCTKETLGPQHLKVQVEGLQNAARVMSEMQAAGRGQQIMELEYTDLIKDPIGAVEHIYKQFGYTSSPEMREGMTNWLNENPQGKHGKHEYSLAEWGLSEQDITSATQQLEGFKAQIRSNSDVSYI